MRTPSVSVSTFRKVFLRLPIAFPAVALLMSVLCLTACDSKKGPPIVGKREAVFMGDDPLKADPKLAGARLTLPKAQVNKAWPSASGSVSHAMDPVFVEADLKRVWSESIGRGSGSSERLLNGPIAADGMLFAVDTRGYVSAYSLVDGTRLWRVDSTPKNKSTQAFSGGLAYEKGALFVVTPAAEIVMLTAKTGEVQKRFALSAPVRAAPTVQKGYIYAVNINNQLEAINYKTGEPAWSHTGIMEIAGLLGGASPALTPDLLVVPYTSGEVHALHPGNGLPLWRESLVSLTKLDPVSSLFHIKARPVIKDGKVYLIGNGGVMRCLDATSGKTLWHHKIGGTRSPSVSGKYLFMVTSNNELACLDRLDGLVYWVSQLPRYKNEEKKEGALLWAGPILVNNQVVVAGSNGQALLLSSQNGEVIHTLDIGERTLVSPIVADGHLIFLTDQGTLQVYR